MNPHKAEDGVLFHHHHDLMVGPPPSPPITTHHHNNHNHYHHHLQTQSQPPISHLDQDDDQFLPEFSDSLSHSSSENDDSVSRPNNNNNNNNINNLSITATDNNHNHNSMTPPPTYISPEPHISTQFYTFNAESHSLMTRCILQQRLATPAEIREATPRTVLKSWRSVWKDRNEDTAFLTAWKRIQDKLTARVDPTSGNEFLCFKNNQQQFVSHFSQWQDIVMNFHGDADLKHLGLKETLEKIKQVWTVGAKFYGIPESFIRACVAACPVCSASSGSGSRSKRRRFEYTESFDVPAKEVPERLQQLAVKHKVVLCIRQKYIRYKPFMAEVKDYACHRAGQPTAKKSRIFKREPYASKRCGCGFRIRAIVPIANYNEKNKTFVYQEDGMAVFKLYAVHSGHEPGPLDGNARIMHRVVGHKGGLMMDQDMIYGVREDFENDGFGYMGKDEDDSQLSVLQQLQDLKTEIGLLEGRIGRILHEDRSTVSRELFDIVNKVRSLGEDSSKAVPLSISDKPQSDNLLVGENDLASWCDHHTDLIEDDEDGFVPWADPSKPDKWLKCSDFDEKSILDCEDSKLTKPMTRHDESIIAADVGLIQVDSFYQENPKWYDSPCGSSEFRHEEIV
ncbi:hypothetical protein ACFE04_019186 [Oxalis oulophora]